MERKIKKAALHNLGCKVNAYEMDVIKQLLTEQGIEVVPFEEKADLYIINTCTVTNIADRKSRQMLHRAKAVNPDAIVVAMGCYVQTGLETALKDEKIDLCIGNNKKGEIISILKSYLNSVRPEEAERENALEQADGNRKAAERTDADHIKTLYGTTVIDIGETKEYEEMRLQCSVERCRAFIKIQDGCNQFCSYCMIPYARGRVRSRRPEAVLEEIGQLAKQGYQEFVITGIHLSSYGSEWEEPDGRAKAGRFYPKHLLELLRQISELPNVRRIRLGSLEPRIVTEDFAKKLSEIRKICPHFHLSLQSGCDETLRRMNRKYTAEEYAKGVETLRKYFDHPAITTDVIVGFPGETDEEFEECRRFLEEVKFFEMHVFKYSKRKGTPAASMKGQLTEAQKAARSDILTELTKRQSETFRDHYIGQTVEVLFEETKLIDGNRYWVGHTPQYVKAAVKADGSDLQNKTADIKVTGKIGSDEAARYLLGEIGRN